MSQWSCGDSGDRPGFACSGRAGGGLKPTDGIKYTVQGIDSGIEKYWTAPASRLLVLKSKFGKPTPTIAIPIHRIAIRHRWTQISRDMVSNGWVQTVAFGSKLSNRDPIGAARIGCERRTSMSTPSVSVVVPSSRYPGEDVEPGALVFYREAVLPEQ